MNAPRLNLVCLIDDDSLIRRVFEMLIVNYNIADKTLCFSNGLTALNYLHKYKDEPARLPELILLDVRMPVIDGWGFMQGYAALAHKLSKKVVVYMVSSSLDYNDHQKAKSLELLSGFIVKPVTKSVLQDMASKVPIN